MSQSPREDMEALLTGARFTSTNGRGSYDHRAVDELIDTLLNAHRANKSPRDLAAIIDRTELKTHRFRMGYSAEEVEGFFRNLQVQARGY